MIRDPSDGSVRDHQPKPLKVEVKQSAAALSSTTGLSEVKANADELARIDRSRKWLAEYRTDPERVARLLGDMGTMTSGE